MQSETNRRGIRQRLLFGLSCAAVLSAGLFAAKPASADVVYVSRTVIVRRYRRHRVHYRRPVAVVYSDPYYYGGYYGPHWRHHRHWRRWRRHHYWHRAYWY